MKYSVRFTKTFDEWLARVKDIIVKKRIDDTLSKLSEGNFSDSSSVGSGVSEVKLHFGPGYRLYYTIRDKEVIFLLCGGTKSTQDKDIAKAKELAKEV